jgi:hypothetical protein
MLLNPHLFWLGQNLEGLAVPGLKAKGQQVLGICNTALSAHCTGGFKCGSVVLWLCLLITDTGQQ